MFYKTWMCFLWITTHSICMDIIFTLSGQDSATTTPIQTLKISTWRIQIVGAQSESQLEGGSPFVSQPTILGFGPSTVTLRGTFHGAWSWPSSLKTETDQMQHYHLRNIRPQCAIRQPLRCRAPVDPLQCGASAKHLWGVKKYHELHFVQHGAVSGEILGMTVKIQVFPTPTSYMFGSFRFLN